MTFDTFREGELITMSHLQGRHVAMALAKNFEDIEATDPKAYLEGHGAKVTVIGLERGEIEGKKGAKLKADTTFDDVSVND
ncbi:MAG TPA: DJ-1/PfpI family protein, partial [Thermomicrobiales bacterium]|nr:DJ-1/PfpI family protein [Thermomicrobiales bacterium]